MIYKICTHEEWDAAVTQGRYDGARVDRTDGFIHFSTAAQVRETAAKHFRQQADLVLVQCDEQALGGHLKWEASRGGDLFPHLYTALDTSLAVNVFDLPLGEDGVHHFPLGLP